jgi:glycerol uptake facilitator protein
MTSTMLGEFLGTCILILLGNGVVAGVVLNKSKAGGAGWIVITAGWAFAVMAGVFTAIACGSTAAHLNPAVTIGFAVASGDWSNAISFITAQLLGAFTGAILVWLHYHPHWAATPDTDAKLACFCTSPAIRKPIANLVSEAIGTFVLVFVVAAIFSKRSSGGGILSPGLGPYLIGSLVWSVGLSLGGTTGYAINPARDFGPRLAHAMLPVSGKGGSDWNYAAVPLVGPVIGGMLAGLLVRSLGL